MHHSRLILHTIHPGLLTTVQDAGRWGCQHLGIPVSGTMDSQSAQFANVLLGNPPDTPVLEMTLTGAKFRVEGKGAVAVVGADMSTQLNGQTQINNAVFFVKDGDELTFGFAKSGMRTYLGIAGIWQVPIWMGSASACPVNTQYWTPISRLQKGSTIIVTCDQEHHLPRTIDTAPPKIQLSPATVNMYPGPEWEQFDRRAIAIFFGQEFAIGQQSSRMGARLDVEIGIMPPKGAMVSSGVMPGTVQITPQGQPIILLADAQTTGGYHRIGQLSTESMDVIAQLKPGEHLRFRLMSDDAKR